MSALVVEIVPVLVVEIVPAAVVDMVPDAVVEIVPAAVVEIVPLVRVVEIVPARALEVIVRVNTRKQAANLRVFMTFLQSLGFVLARMRCVLAEMSHPFELSKYLLAH
jgi:hypothetical protein